MMPVEQIAEQMFGVFDNIFSKVQKRALNQQEQERLRREVFRLCGLIGEMSNRATFEKLTELQDKVNAGFSAVEKELDSIKVARSRNRRKTD